MRREPDPDAVKAAADRAEALADGRKHGPQRGRGRLSSIDELPEEAAEDVLWAVAELNKRGRSQEDIRFEFNDRLARKGIDEVSRSAFNRYSIRHAANAKRLDDSNRLMAAIAPRFTSERVDENTVAIAELLKILVFDLAQLEGQEVGPKGAMELSKALLAIIQSQKISADRKILLQREFKAEAEKAIERVATAKGLSADTATALRAELFGQVAPAKPAEPPHGP